MRAPGPGGSSRRPAALAILLALAVVYLVHTYLYSPKLRDSEAILFRVGEMRAWGARTAASIPPGAGRAAASIEAYKSRMRRLESLVPASEDLAELLDAISRAEGRAGVEVTMLRPEDPAPSAAAAGATSAPTGPGAPYEDRGYRVAVTGGYHQIASFITAIASLDRIMVPADLALTPGPAPPAGRATPAPPAPRSVPLVADFRILTIVAPKETQQ